MLHQSDPFNVIFYFGCAASTSFALCYWESQSSFMCPISTTLYLLNWTQNLLAPFSRHLCLLCVCVCRCMMFKRGMIWTRIGQPLPSIGIGLSEVLPSTSCFCMFIPPCECTPTYTRTHTTSGVLQEKYYVFFFRQGSKCMLKKSYTWKSVCSFFELCNWHGLSAFTRIVVDF